jgi:hypothetical protein
MGGLPLVLLAVAAVWACVRGTDGGPGPEAAPAPGSDAGLEGIRRRSNEKVRLARELIDGRLTLAEAAARYRELDEQSPDFYWDVFRRTYVGASDEERHCREVIHYIRLEVGDNGRASTKLVSRLEAELHARYASDPLPLPGPEGSSQPDSMPVPARGQPTTGPGRKPGPRP